jgi:hypothetical protein
MGQGHCVSRHDDRGIKVIVLLNGDPEVQDLPSLLVAQATAAVEECDACLPVATGMQATKAE